MTEIIDIKMKRYTFLKNCDQLKDALPLTEYLSSKKLWELLDRFNSVILKPIYGSRGRGVIKISIHSENQHVIHIDDRKLLIKGRLRIIQFLKKRFNFSQYLVQQYIPLATIHNKPFDLRVMVQRLKGGSWNVTGKLAKLAGDNFIITNVARSGGVILSMESALIQSKIVKNTFHLIDTEVDKLAVNTVSKLTEMYPYQVIWGLDIGIDSTGKAWLIEANAKPNITMFKKLEDKSLYEVIKSYKKLNAKNNNG